MRKHVLQRRGLIASSAQRAPKAVLTPAARAEVEYLLARLARHDRAQTLSPRPGGDQAAVASAGIRRSADT